MDLAANCLEDLVVLFGPGGEGHGQPLGVVL